MASFAVIFLMKMTYSWLADKDSHYPFTDAGSCSDGTSTPG